MGKRSKGKKGRKLKYTKEEFETIICGSCNLCLIQKKPNCDFCYDFYKQDRKKFINKIYPTLRNTTWPDKYLIQLSIFCNLFCVNCKAYKSTNKNTSVCKNLVACMHAFSNQTDPVFSKSLKSSIFNKNAIAEYLKIGEKRKEPFVVQPYPTFFYSNNLEWEKEVQEIYNSM